MPPDISTGPMALAAGTPPGRAYGWTAAGPPGSDPLAALFAALLANSDSSPPLPGVPTQPSALFKPSDEPAADKTQEKILSAALPTVPLLLTPTQKTPIQRVPFTPPNAGVTVEQKTTEKTMDTSPVPASPEKDKASVKPDGELPLQRAGINTSGASTLFPAFLIASPTIASPTIASPTIASPTIASPTIASPLPPVVPSVDRVMALPDVQGHSVSASPLPVSEPKLPRTAPVASPGVFALGATAAPTMSLPAAPSQPASADYVPQPQGFPVPVDAVFKLTKLPATETVAAALPTMTLPTVMPSTVTLPTVILPIVAPPIPASAAAEGTGQASPGAVQVSPSAAQASPSAAQVLVPTLPQAISAVAVQTAASGEVYQGLLPGAKSEAPSTVKAPIAAPLSAGTTATNELTVTDGIVAKDGKIATDGSTATEGKIAMDVKAAMDGVVTTDGRTATEGKVLTAGGTPEKGLLSAAMSADTITGGKTVPANTLPTDLGFQVIGKRADQRTESIGNDALPALPTPVPAQAETVRTDAKPLTAADRADMVRQVADGVGAMPLPAKPGASEQMTLQLHPKDWGQLQVSVKITPGSQPNAIQTVTAHIVAQSPEVKAALENQSGDLRQALREAGLHLDQINVTVQRMDASAQAGTATSGGRHEANQGGAGQGMGGAFGETTPNQKTGMSGGTGMSGASGNGMPSFTASGESHDGRQGGQPPPAYAAAYASAEPEDVSPWEAPRRLATGQVDIRA